jgi:hypothetical protein
MLAISDHCHSAREVREAAHRAADWRRQVWGTPAPVERPIPQYQPWRLRAAKTTPAAPLAPPVVKTVPTPTSTTRRLIKAILAAAAEHYGVTIDDIMSRRRLAPIVRARQVSMFLIRNGTPLSLPRIGAIFDRDHTTVLHSEQLIGSRDDLRSVAAKIAAAAQAAATPTEGEAAHGE